MSPKLRLRLLGGFRLEDGEGCSVALSLRKSQALLAYLAVVKGQSASRDRLIGLLWGGSDPRRARQSLRQTLVSLTRDLGPRARDLLQLEGQDIRLAVGAVSVDVVDMEWLLAEGSKESLVEAKALYRGDFLAGLEIEAPEYDDWLQDLRGQLRDAIVLGMEELFERQAAADEIGAAVATGNQVIRIDPLREDMHRKLIRLYAGKGMRSSALAQYRACRDILAAELGVEPDRDTQALVEDMLDQRKTEERRSALRLDCIAGAGPAPAETAETDGDGFERLFGPVAGAVEQLRSQVLKTHYHVLTRQLCESGKPHEALEAVLRGARLERKRGSPHAAQAILEQALASLDAESPTVEPEAGPAAAELHLGLAGLAEDRGDIEAARQSLSLADDCENRSATRPSRPARIPLAWSRVLARSGREGDALTAARRGLALSGPSVDSDAWLPAERWVAQLHLSIARANAMAQGLVGRIESGRSLGLVGDEAEARALLAVITASRGDLARGREESARAVELSEQAASPATSVVCHEAQGLVFLWAGRSLSAIGCFDSALRAAQARGDLLREYLLRGLRGAALLAEGRHDQAWSALKQAEARARDLDTQFMLPFFKAWTAETVCASGRYGDKRTVCEEALSFARESNQPWAASIAGRAMARCLADPQINELAQAERAIDWAVGTQRDLGLDFDLARSLMIQARLLELRDEKRGAESVAGEAERLILRIGTAGAAAGPDGAEPAGLDLHA